MISNANSHTIAPWKHTSHTNRENNVKLDKYETTIKGTRFIGNDDSNNQHSNNKYLDKNINQDIKNNFGDIQKDNTVPELVAFERIVPKAVKQLWKHAVESLDSGYNIDKEHHNHQNMIRVAQHHELDKRISHEYGDIFLSHDLAREDEISPRTQIRNSSVSESPELPVARNKWGINLRHVITRGDSVEVAKNDVLPFNFPKLRSLSSHSSRNRSCSITEDYVQINHKLRRTQSFDILNIDNTDECAVDVNRLNEVDDLDTLKKLSVHERRQTFESRNKVNFKFKEIVSYAYNRSKSPNKRENSISRGGQQEIFYTGPPIQLIPNTPDGSKLLSPSEKKAPVSLIDLLKLDELKLTEDVLDTPRDAVIMKKKNQKQIEEKNTSDDIISVLQHSSAQNQSIVKTTSKSNVELANNIAEVDMTMITNKTEDETSLKLQTNQRSISRNESTQLQDKAKIVRKIFFTSTETDNNKAAPLTSGMEKIPSASQNKSKDTEKVLIANNDFTDKHVDTVSTSQDYFQKMEESEPITQPKDTIKSQDTMPISKPIKYNKLGQIILDDILPKSELKVEKALDKSKNKEEINTQVEPSVPAVKVLPNNNRENIPSLNTSSQNGYVETETKQPAFFDALVSPSDFDVLMKTSNTDNKLPSESLTSSQKQDFVELQPSLTQQKRRVGKLIIMTGEQRDEQLRNANNNNISSKQGSSSGGVRQITLKKEVVGNSPSHTKPNSINGGLALTFMSNELDGLEDDPNEPPSIVPKIVFNGPTRSTKSIMSPEVNKNKNKKKIRVSFSSTKLATVYSYPSEASYFEEGNSSASNSITSVSLTSLSSYQPSSVNDLGTVVQRERERIQHTSNSPRNNNNDTYNQSVIQYSTEGDHFNVHHAQAGGHALLF